MDAFNFAGIRNFVFEKPQEIYIELVRMFYVNLSKMSSQNPKSRNTSSLSLENFAEVCNLPFFEQDLEGNEFNFDVYAHTLVIDPSCGIPSPFIVCLICPNNILIRYKMNHVFSQGKVTITPFKNQTFLQLCFWKTKLRKLGRNRTSPHAR